MQHRTLLELNQLIRNTLDASLEPAYWVVAEIADMRINQKGHCYLDLVEKEDERIVARMRANIWAYTFRSVSAWFESQSGQSLKNGLKILCQVNVSFHELYGLSLTIREIDPRYTMGERARKRQEIIERLKTEGVFEINKMHELPLLPRRIAVISSASAAGYGDFMNQLEHNPWGYAFDSHLYNSLMQGDQASDSIIDALNRIHGSNIPFDLVLILRGGGAQVDLDCFDTYALSNHIAQFPIPVITGIGHERDQTIADLVAHTSVKTPTAAAEFIISGVRSFEERLVESFQRLVNLTSERLSTSARNLAALEYQLKKKKKTSVHAAEKRINDLKSSLAFTSKAHLKEQKNRLELAGKSIDYINPANILKRGYTMTLVNGKGVNSKNIKEGDTVETIASTYTMYSTIKEIHTNE